MRGSARRCPSRIGFAVVREMLAAEAIGTGRVGSHELAALASHVFWKADEYSAALTTAHREPTNDLLRRHDQERSVGALTTGTFEHGSVWGVATRPGLPGTGTFATAAAVTQVVGSVVPPDFASRLRAVNVSSAWRLLPDVEVGVLALPGPDASGVLRSAPRGTPSVHCPACAGIRTGASHDETPRRPAG